MHKASGWALGLALLTLLPAGAEGPTTGSDPCQGRAVQLPEVCGAPLRPVTVSCDQPADVEGGLAQPNRNLRQRAADLFSWQTFLALNWPAIPDKRGEPAFDEPLRARGPRVWETWKEVSEVFRQSHGEPLPPLGWNDPEPIPPSCVGASKLLVRRTKVEDVLDSAIQPTAADGSLPPILTDQRGRLVRYEIRMNRAAFDAVVSARAWDARSQAELGSFAFPPGAILVKAAWVPVDTDQSSRFLVADACVCEAAADGSPEACRRRPMGLAGFHVMAKTPSAPQWLWSTFEQIDNVAGLTPTFFDSRCDSCEADRQTPAHEPTQVTRVIPIPAHEPNCNAPEQAVDNLAALNTAIENAIAETAFSHYQLINTQWPLRPAAAGSEPATVFDAVPPLLGNTTLETFIQESSSCMGCHAMARTARPDRFVSADFSFTLNDAAPTLPNREVLAAPAEPESDWDREHWNDVLRGAALAGATYELLGKPAVGARLHCGSCHLASGRDPAAAWWVGMAKKYDYPATAKLAARINQCFERSLNGAALCTPGAPAAQGGCDGDPRMRALILYMEWLDESWQKNHSGNPANGFPPVAAHTGEPARGASIFLQKCAFCHGLDGQGRYPSDTYFRPALWGPQSFNASAGMASPATLAAFAHANMPLGSGGELTPQEAWDLACYLDSQPRPGKSSPGAGCRAP
ncbi:MAG: c-type cytochrome [Thermoanaerobaculia bacterium]